MKVLHIMLAANFRENFGYQENILPAKHKQFGCDVSIITRDMFNAFGDLKADERGVKTYINNNGVKVIVLPNNDSLITKLPLWIFRKFIDKTKYLYETLEIEKPDVIFVHNLLASDHEKVVKYKHSHPDIRVYCDNHGDYYNSPVKSLKDIIVKKIIGRRYVRHLTDVCNRVWGVTPWRVDYLRDVYGVGGSKVGLLVMGGDERLIDWENRSTIREQFRREHSIPQNAFVVVTGGKIDKPKNIHLLIEAVKSIDNPLLYLVVFGNYSDDIKKYAEEDHSRIVNIGWIASDAVYNIFLASDLGAFPGTHSVLWEQACASGLPCLFKDWNGGFNHVDLGGNCILLKDITIETLAQTLREVMSNKSLFENMCEVADKKCRKEFSYMEIAKKAIELD